MTRGNQREQDRLKAQKKAGAKKPEKQSATSLARRKEADADALRAKQQKKAEEQAKQNAAGPSSGASSAQQPSSKSAKPSKQQQQPQAAPAAHTKIVQQEVRDANEADTSRSTTVAAATTNKGEDGVTPTSKSAGSSDRM